MGWNGMEIAVETFWRNHRDKYVEKYLLLNPLPKND